MENITRKKKKTTLKLSGSSQYKTTQVEPGKTAKVQLGG